jgi:hypothetical protein
MRRRQVGRSRGGRRWAGPATAGEVRRRTYGRGSKDGGAPVRSQRRREAVAGGAPVRSQRRREAVAGGGGGSRRLGVV